MSEVVNGVLGTISPNKTIWGAWSAMLGGTVMERGEKSGDRMECNVVKNGANLI